MSLALQLYQQLCILGNALERLRDTYAPMTDAWLWHTEVLGLLDASIDLLVHSDGFDQEDA
jgi:hypothetical protein